MSELKEKSFEKRQEVINAAFREFSENGYEKASLNNILKEAGISKGTFYYHFKNKEDLYFYLIEILIEQKKKFFMERITPQDYYNNSIFEIFKLQAEMGLELATRNPILMGFGESFLKERGNEIYSKAMHKYNLDENDYFKYIIDNAFSKGEFREDIPKDFISRIISFLFRNITDIANITKIEDYEDPFKYLVEFLKDGLAKK